MRNCFYDVQKWLYDVEVEQEFHFWSEKCTKATEKNCKHAWATFWQWGKQQKIKTSQKKNLIALNLNVNHYI